MKSQAIASLIQQLENCTEFGKPEQADNVNKTYNFYSKLFYFYCIVGVTIWFILAQTIEGNNCRSENEKFDRDEVCGFVVHIWLPFNYNYTPAYEILFVLQYFACIYGGPVLTIFFMVFVVLQHITCKIRHLKIMADGIFECHNYVLQKKRLIHCIRYHQHIIKYGYYYFEEITFKKKTHFLRLCDLFNYCFGHITFLYITLGAFALSITCYQSIRVQK